MSGVHPPNRYGGRHARGDDPRYGGGPGYEPDEPPAWRSGRSEYGESGYASSADGGYPGYGQTSGYGAGTGYGATGYGETGCSAAPGYRPAFGHEANAYGASSAHSPRRSTAYGPADGYPPAPGEYGDYAGGYRSDGDGTGRHTYRADHGYGADHPGSGYPSTYPGSDHPPKPGRPTYAGYPQPSAYTERPGYTEPTGYAGQAGYSPAGEYPQPEYQTPPQTRERATATLPAPAARRGPPRGPRHHPPRRLCGPGGLPPGRGVSAPGVPAPATDAGAGNGHAASAGRTARHQARRAARARLGTREGPRTSGTGGRECGAQRAGAVCPGRVAHRPPVPGAMAGDAEQTAAAERTR